MQCIALAQVHPTGANPLRLLPSGAIPCQGQLLPYTILGTSATSDQENACTKNLEYLNKGTPLI